MWMPSSFGTWSSTITRPIPALKPVSTGAEMKFATNPRLSSRASDQDHADQPGERRRRGDQLRRIAVGHHQASCVPARMASVVVELTLSTREVPSSA